MLFDMVEAKKDKTRWVDVTPWQERRWNDVQTRLYGDSMITPANRTAGKFRKETYSSEEALAKAEQLNKMLSGANDYTQKAEGNINSILGAAGKAYDMFDVQRRLQDAEEAIDPDLLRSMAAGDVQNAYDNVWGQNQRNLSRMGVDPTSGRYASLRDDWGRALAAAVAGAKTKAPLMANEQRMQIANLSGQLAGTRAGLDINAGTTAAHYYADQAQGAAEMAGWLGAFK